MRISIQCVHASLFALLLSEVAASGAPEVGPGEGAAVGITKAVLNAELTAGSDSEMWIDWGEAEQDQPPTVQNVTNLGTRSIGAFKVAVSSLSADTTHAYRVRATNINGSATSAWVWFTTYPANFETVPDPPWFSGGSFDGYDVSAGRAAPDYPQIHNLSGATNVQTISAWLNGILTHTGGAPASVWVFWGKTDGTTNQADWSNSHELGIVPELTPLTHQAATDSGCIYYYRFYATNSHGASGQEGWAPESSIFETPAAPQVSTGPGAATGITKAVLYGELMAGIEAEMWLDWGEAEQGQPPAAVTVIDMGVRTVEGTLEAPNPFREALDTLSPETTYAYRIRATNENGSATSAWVWFTTYPESFETVSDPPWFSGGSYDGYDHEMIEQTQMPGSMRAFLIKMF